jgi:LmbE family N-acetylglucosaminyl deacetylase
MIVLALGCHPDDIEFMMGGTLILLKKKGHTLHYMNIANGSCGTQTQSRDDFIKIRREEGKSAASLIGAIFHESLTDDLDVFYTHKLIRKVAATIRQVQPDILLAMSMEDYMEDHMNAARIAVTAAFIRGVPNYDTDPPTTPYIKDIALYHALPYGLKDMMRRKIYPEFYVNVVSVMDKKTEMLAKHESQKNWLLKSQGLDSYLRTMADMTKEVGSMSEKFEFSEGWRRHNHLGYSSTDIDPLKDILGDLYFKPLLT